MLPKVISSENPYILDRLENDLPALTRKNAEFIKGVVNLDSNYAKDLKITPPSSGYNPEINVLKAGKLYCGSTAYWFNEMSKPESNFSYCVLGAIIAIDTTNSTHLESAKNGRSIMRDRICEVCTNSSDLLHKLNIPFTPNDDQHLIRILTKETPSTKKGEYRTNLSFASKFCANASRFLKGDFEYSKYDNVVSDALPKFMFTYLNEKKNTKEYSRNGKPKKQEEYTPWLMNLYDKYSKDIQRIINYLSTEGIQITREELDQIIWYGMKGSNNN